MKKYDELKLENTDKLVIVKSGIFYVAYDEDAKILNYLLNYKIINNRVGFPLNNKDEVIKKVNGYGISVIIDEETYKSNKKNNCYYEVLDKALNKVRDNDKLKELFKLIEIKIRQYKDNYDLIWEFVNEL